MSKLLRGFLACVILCAAGALSQVQAQTCPCSIWSASDGPAVIDGGDPSAGEYGVRFQPTTSGYITAISFYKAASNTGVHIGNVWSAAGTLLGTVTFTNESASGWQRATLSTPVAVTAGVTYVASYFTSAGHYSFSGGYFTSSAGTGPVIAPADGAAGANGVYAYSATSRFPTATFNASNYWVDVTFNTAVVPAVVEAAPTGTGVSLSPSIAARFNEPINPASVSSSTFRLADATGSLVSAVVTYAAATQTASLQPTSALQAGTSYTATLVGGAGGVTDLNGNVMPGSVTWTFTTQASVPQCPCSLWNLATLPGTPDGGDSNAGEFGVKFTSDVAGAITGLRFYKAATNTGTHVAHLWSAAGTLLASASFSSESVSGWQQVAFTTPVPLTANTTYVASYSTQSGHYAFTDRGLASGFDNTPLHAIADSTSVNGVYSYGAPGVFPASSYDASNYWVDVVFEVPGAPSAPRVVATAPFPGAVGANYGTVVSAIFNKALNPSSVTASSLTVTDAQGSAVAGVVAYDASTYSIHFTPTLGFVPLTTYKATVSGTVSDTLGTSLGSNFTWSFTVAAPPAPSGPGGPILVIASVRNPFTYYYDEILRAEGLNEFTVADITLVTPSLLSPYDVAILGDMPLTATQASTLSSWVNAGGKLIAMHPDPQLAGLLGLTTTAQSTTGGYLLVNTTQAPGTGIVGSTIQYHGPATLFRLAGATPIAMLYTSATQATTFPAVTQVRAGNGTAAAFAYDLARSVIYTRQGNPAWSGQSRDPYIDPAQSVPGVIRSDDLFYGNAASDPQADYVDLANVLIPQADEQQRLLANMITTMDTTRPLPRFWYLPSGFKAAIVMTGDDHNSGGTAGRFQNYISASPANCSVADWQCIRSTSYIWPGTPLTAAQAQSFVAQGFEISIHPDSEPSCSNWTPSQLQQMYASYALSQAQNWPGVPAPRTVRTHCITWSDYDTQPQVELQNGIRFDTNYYYWPDLWVKDRPGLFTGSGMPMRFATRAGQTIDVYQAATQFPDETTWTWPTDIDTILNNATGPLGYYGVFTANMHTDFVASTGSDAMIASAKAHGIPVVSSVQMLTWLDGRNASAFSAVNWSGNTLKFTITPGTGARNLTAMLPAVSANGALTRLTLSGTAVPLTTQILKGVSYAVFAANAGAYQATYAVSLSGSVSGVPAPVTISLTGTSTATATTDAAGNYAFGGLANGTYTVTPSAPGFLFTPQTVTYSGTPLTGINFVATAVTLRSLALSATSVTGGTAVSGTLTLTGMAPAGGALISLTSSNPAIAVTPASVTIPANAMSASFTITTAAVATTAQSNIAANYGSASSSVSLTVNPAQLSAVTLSPASLVGGNASSALVRLTGPAPAGGLAVALVSSNPAAALVPASVTVAAGQLSATATVTTSPVSSITAAVVTATLATFSANATLTVNPPGVSAVALSPTELIGGAGSATGTITLSGRAPATGALVNLNSSSPASAAVPATVTVAAGATTAVFSVTTAAVTSNVVATITATYNTTASATLKVDTISIASVVLIPSSLVGGNNATATITLNSTALSSATILLRSNNAAASVPSSVVVPAGSRTATVSVGSSPVAAQSTAIITATYGTSVSANLTINPPQVSSLTLLPSTVIGGLPSAGTVTLTGRAPSAGITVTLLSSNTAVARTPLSLTIPANLSSGLFTISTSPVAGNTSVTVFATRGTTARAVLTVLR